MGTWLQRKWNAMNAKKFEAEIILNNMEQNGYTKDYLAIQWNEQVIYQTKPLKKQSKAWANKEIEEILLLSQNLDTYKKECNRLESMIETGIYEENITLYIIQENLEELQEKISKTKKAISNKRAKLSVDGRLNLTKLLNNEFLKLRMNALALKQRIRDRLRMRKFELENMERAYRSSINEAKLQKHVHQQIKRKEPGIQSLVRNYNKACVQLESMIAQKKAPRGAIAPLPIIMEGLFKLDVDDNIWQDIGFDDDENETIEIPDWLGKEDVRKGIKALLEYNRCIEEERRLIEEKKSMIQWFREEWVVIIKAIGQMSEDINVLYQLKQRKQFLLRLYLSWELPVRGIPGENNTLWGPTKEEIIKAKKYETTQSVLYKEYTNEVADIEMELEDDNEYEDEHDNNDDVITDFEDGDEAELLDQIEEDLSTL
ncbi:hypothetical protein JR316_0002247 [Psilocybe cubensis]|uniref:Uncharacterized protein n=2 Tax=Psilocybe cubensis TaxID=181762 RepID=A0ACB8HCD1_PSICU|nr:hypothetical protein JR316_0002247 [Psilocybe cubensis]KAH9485339.1 hypothetical protein JR316_0002247 [Psilocybe cubensis]